MNAARLLFILETGGLELTLRVHLAASHPEQDDSESPENNLKVQEKV